MSTITLTGVEHITTTSENYITIDDMVFTPPVGKYCVFFSANVSSTLSDANCKLSIFQSNTEQLEATRLVLGDSDGRSPNLKMALFTQTTMEFDGIKELSVRWKTDKGIFKIFSRSLILVPCN